MREYLFRGKRVDNGEWVESNCFYQCNGKVKLWDEPNRDGYVEVEKETLGLFTGLTDKNGTKIFEGDICRFREWSKGEMCWVGKVHWEHQQFMITGGPNKECETVFELCMSRFIPENIEVIGNIHDNPELLAKK